MNYLQTKCFYFDFKISDQAEIIAGECAKMALFKVNPNLM